MALDETFNLIVQPNLPEPNNYIGYLGVAEIADCCSER